MQLTVDHDLTNDDELLRLSHTGLDVEKLKSVIFLFSLLSTRVNRYLLIVT